MSFPIHHITPPVAQAIPTPNPTGFSNKLPPQPPPLGAA